MANYDIRPLQLHILKILQAVDKVCKEHHLHYYLWAGTMLGAVRHKGFIPWDDDVDVCMEREDYNRFLELWQKEPVDGYLLQNKETEEAVVAVKSDDDPQ